MYNIPKYLVFLWIIPSARPRSLLRNHHNHDSSDTRGSRRDGIRSCNTPEPDENEIKDADSVYENYQLRTAARSVPTTPISVPTVFHIITDGEGGNGYVSDATIAEQLVILNSAFNPYFNFYLKAPAPNPTRTSNNTYFDELNDQDTMKNDLRQGGCDTLNIYSNSGYGFLGFAYYPNSCNNNKKRDGVVIDYKTFPGGSYQKYNEGDTVVHEVGHWLGLFHTFHGDDKLGCGGIDDKVDDTPTYKRNLTCNPGANTCVNETGDDPISNFMNYTPDDCMENFTKGQFERMISQWMIYRNIVTPSPTSTPLAVVTPSPTSTPLAVVTPSPTSTPLAAVVTPSPTSTSKTSDLTCKKPARHFRAEIENGDCGKDIKFFLEKQKKNKKWKKIGNKSFAINSNNINVDKCFKKRFCYRYKVVDLSTGKCFMDEGAIKVYMDDELLDKPIYIGTNFFLGKIGKNCEYNVKR